MSFLKWSEKFSVGSNLLDTDHKRLFDLVQKLYTVSQDLDNQKQIVSVLVDLIDHTRAHFLHEETLMRRTAYPSFIHHKIEHDRLINQIEAFRKNLAAGQVGMAQERLAFLQTWLCEHISKIDKPLGRWLTKNNLQDDPI
ncbi:MAG TPA: hemerythrin [Rhodospirillaceae bacterium]|nr:hemerythrin [Rhodospirillaceae bacterium]